MTLRMKWLVIAAAALTGVMLALAIAVALITWVTQPSPDPQQQFLQWETCELNLNQSGGANDPCGPMPVP